RVHVLVEFGPILVTDFRINIVFAIIDAGDVAERQAVVLHEPEVAVVVISRELAEEQAAAHALELRALPEVLEADRVEDGDLVREIARVVLVAEERADVSVDELVVDLAFEQNVLDQ